MLVAPAKVRTASATEETPRSDRIQRGTPPSPNPIRTHFNVGQQGARTLARAFPTLARHVAAPQYMREISANAKSAPSPRTISATGVHQQHSIAWRRKRQQKKKTSTWGVLLIQRVYRSMLLALGRLRSAVAAASRGTPLGRDAYSDASWSWPHPPG
ncbi:hypothetical protein BJ912DRAFT_968355 [Pholiota molesta]|nr:hypothetical protein BJ912DRAFT_968355 [Pholiota molesta]